MHALTTNSVYTWKPCVGPSENLLQRMTAYTPKPDAPLLSTWRMSGTIEEFTELSLRPVDELSDNYLSKVLSEIYSSRIQFNDEPEYRAWLQYLIPHVTNRGQHLIQETITGCLVLSRRPDAAYPLFFEDVLWTLGQSNMSPKYWGCYENGSAKPVRDKNSSSLLSASIFLVLTYLEVSRIPNWVDSLFQIDDAQWKLQLIHWLAKAKTALTTRPFNKALLDGPKLGWSGSYALLDSHNGTPQEPPLLSDETLDTFIKAINSNLSIAVLEQWTEEIAEQIDLTMYRDHDRYLTDVLDYCS